MAKVRFRGAKHSPKKLEKEILERSKALWEDPEILRPTCIGSCRRCHFDKPLAKMHAMDRIKDDADKLVKAASRGDPMARAYAATASLYASGKIPYLATARFPGEEVSFAVRGKVGQDKLIGAQYHDDPHKRPLLYMEMAKKKRLWLYSLDGGMACSDRPNMPDDYLREALDESPYELDESHSCGHEGREALVVSIPSRGERLRVCRDCAGGENLLQPLLSRVVASRPMDDLLVGVEHPYRLDDGSVDEVPPELLERYRTGRIGDRELIDSVLRERRRGLREKGVAVYVMGGRNYGDDLEALMADVQGSEEEKAALRAALGQGAVPLVMEGSRASEALQELWGEHAEAMVLAVSSQEVLDGMGGLDRMQPGPALQEALFRERSRKILSSLPSLGRLGEIGSLADRLARLAKTGDPLSLRREIESKSLRDYKARSVALAFIKATCQDESSLWQFSREEADFASYLQQFASMMVEADGEAYRDALEAMLTASGSAEKIGQ